MSLEETLKEFREFCASKAAPRSVLAIRRINVNKWLASRAKVRMLGIEEVVEAVARHFAISTDDVMRNRCARPTMGRHIAMYILRKHSRMSYPEIARLFSFRDHTGAFAAVRKIVGLLDCDATTREDVHAIETTLPRKTR